MSNYTIKRNDPDRDKVYLLKTLRNMKARCSGKYKHYSSYKTKNIQVCKEWIDNPLAFVKWAKTNGWASGLTIDRIDNNGNYEPCNCRWITNRENVLESRQGRVSRGKSKYVGVWFREDTKVWTTEIKHNKKKISLGTFRTEDDAMLYREYYIRKHNIPYLKRNINSMPSGYVPRRIINTWKDLEDDVILEIYNKSKDGQTASSLGKEYGISRKAIPQIKKEVESR